MAAKRGRETVADMVWSLIAVTGAVLLLLLLFPRSNPDPVQVIDPSTDIAIAERAAGYDVRTPAGLPEGWRPTSSRVGVPDAAADAGVTLHIGYVTPSGEYAGVEQSDGPSAPFVAEHTDEAPTTGTVDIDGIPWRQYRDRDGELALSRSFPDGGTVVIEGSAPLAELRDLAASLR